MTDQVADGTQAAQITLRDDIIFEPYNQSRVEVKHNGLHTKDGEDSYYAWSFMVPADAEIRSNIGYWESRTTSRNTMTFFIEPGEGGTVIKFGTGNLGETVRWTQKLELNQWHRLAIQNHWSQSQADGKVSVWYDGAQVVSDVTVTKYDVNELFFQMGLHRSDPSPPVQVIYIDAAIEADSQEDLLKALPDPMGMGGTGGLGGMGGAAGAGGLDSAGSAGEVSGGVGGASAGAAGAAGAAGLPAAGGTATAGQAGGGTSVPTTSNASSGDAGGCSISSQGSRDARDYAWLLAAAYLIPLRRRLRS